MNLRKRELFLVLGGVVLGFFILVVANAGMSVSDSRPFCGSCHIMQQVSLTQKNSSHANLSCNDCHAPHALGNKLVFKAKAGAKDIYSNLFHDDQFVSATAETKFVINENCKRCHFGTNQNVSSMSAKENCTSCHRNVPHMRMKKISTKEIGDA